MNDRWLILPALGGALVLEIWIAPRAENHPWVVFAALAVVALLTLPAAYLLLEGTTWLAVVTILLGGLGWGLVEGWDARDNYIGPYCEYGARTQNELDRCLDRVNSDEIDNLDTPPAQFARGETTTCGRGAGPFCRGEATSK